MASLENGIPPPFLTLFLAVVMWSVSRLGPASVVDDGLRWGLVGLFFLVGGLFGFPAIRAFLSARTTIDPVHIERASTLVTTGIYRISRNPMYVGLACLLLTWAAYLTAPWAFLGPLAFVLFVTRFQILPEERAMAAKFGADYISYKSRVRRWI